MLLAGAAALAGSSASESMALRGAPAEGRRIAVLIGIADYKNFGADGPPGQSDLRGPLNDVSRMRASLSRFGFADSLMHVLVDSQATRAGIQNILVGLEREVTSPHDVVIVYFSGHGTQVSDAGGDEDDGSDEALVPWDAADIRNAGQVVPDDSLGAWLGRLQTRNITLVIDACFSGTITRDMGRAISRGAPATAAAVRNAANAHAVGNAAPALSEVPFAVITAAASDELALELPWPEIGDRYSGVLTYQLTRLLDQVAGSTIRYDAFMGLVRDEVRRWTRQTPQLEGSAEARAARLFDVSRDTLPPATAAVTALGGSRFRVAIGAVHGVRRGTAFDLHEADGVRRFLGQLVVDSIGDDFSRALATDAIPVLPANARASISTMPPSMRANEKLSVWVAPTLVGVAAAVRNIHFARLTSDSASADASLVPHQSGMRLVVLGLPVAPLPRWQYPTLASYGPWVSDSAELVGVRGTQRFAYAATAAATCRALRRGWAISGVSSVSNPARNYNLTLELRVVRVGSTPPNDDVSVADTLVEGERYDVLVRATSYTNAPVFLGLALAGYRGIPLPSLLPAAGGNAIAAFDSVNLKTNNGWARVRFGRAGAPFGSDIIKGYFGAFPYSFHQLIASTPGCVDVGTRGLERDPAITGWSATERRIVFAPRTARAPSP